MERMIGILAAVILAVSGLTAGCGTDQKENAAKEQADVPADSGDSADTKEPVKEVVDEGTDVKTEEKTEVSREDFPDCDGSGHGYIEIHYSDGSVEIEEY